MQKGYQQYIAALAMPNLFNAVTGYYDFWETDYSMGWYLKGLDFTPQRPNAIGSRGGQLVAQYMPHIRVEQYRVAGGARIYDGYNTLTGNYVEIKTSIRGVYYHSGRSSSQVAYDAASGSTVEWIFVNCKPGGSLATDLNSAANIIWQSLNVGW
jgi:hypothetical protein